MERSFQDLYVPNHPKRRGVFRESELCERLWIALQAAELNVAQSGSAGAAVATLARPLRALATSVQSEAPPQETDTQQTTARVTDATASALAALHQPLNVLRQHRGDIKSLEVRCDVVHRYARTEVLGAVENPADESKVLTFGVLLPEEAFLSGFEM
ncbi:hypothetical protein R5R35_010574 [Gryllus longicercus]|uniref:VIT domain-containing protein n=1 Tax=Gryllus longicercus TaxID=2509291 RepID=A0AAN9VF84_9ORTH